MRLGGRLQAAIDILNDIEECKHPVSEALKNWGVSHRFAGSGDRAAIGNIVYDAVRHRSSIAWRMQSESAIDIAYGALLCDSGMDMVTVRKNLTDDSFAPPLLDEEKQLVWQSRHLADAPVYIQADVPQWCMASLEKLFGADWVKEGRALAERPPLDLRVNILKTTPEKVARGLKDIGALPMAWYKKALRIAPVQGLRRHPNVQVEPAFQKGWFEVQDLGSQIAAHLCRARPGMQILDYCAGAGGKTVALAADMRNQGQIHAYDAEKTRLAPIFSRLRRAGIRNTQVHTNTYALAALSGHMDMVVVDAPCTGTGIWRRRPDTKWRLTESQLERRVEEQRTVLDKAAAFVRPGGRLIYITCSLLFEENDEQVKNFLAYNADFQICDMMICWHENIVQRDRISTLLSEQTPLPRFSEYGLVLSPFSTGTDGFFVSIMEKNV
ncbi:MAG: SUN-family protein [Candidatus Tokpelaia sp. JSC189]|nr:MAG: SUN-family protein [Candidatus Tokpelaia sp. JSC189]